MPIQDPFEYQPPNEHTKPRYEALYAAHRDCAVVIGGVEYLMILAGSSNRKDHARIGGACKTFADVITANCPPSSDRDHAIKSVRMARMWANKAVATGHGNWTSFMQKSHEHLTEAKFWACSSVALAFTTELPEV